MERIKFHLNGVPVELDGVSPTTTLLRYLRDRERMVGTKEGCAEGDCGACSVAISERRPDGANVYRSVCSCLVFLPMVQNKQVYTVEGIADPEPHPTQRAVAELLASQCGYCTPGVTMSLFEACYRDDLDEPWKLDAQMCGNLCRCTGYRPIREALKRVAGTCPQDQYSLRLRDLEPADMQLAYRAGEQAYYTPKTFAELFDVLDREPEARLIAGGTDLALEVTKKFATLPVLVSLEALPELAENHAREDLCSLGATASLSDLESFSRFPLPSIERMLRYFGSRQIKNRATLGGNLCTASPIGDLAPVLLSLRANAVLRSKAGERTIPLDDFFLSYRKTALAKGEILARVEVPRPRAEARIASYKVSKRRELDISTVAAAFNVSVGAEGRVDEARLAYGGMAATPARAKLAEQHLIGRPWTEDQVRAAASLLDQDFKPISDHRGSAWYRAAVAKNLLRGFFLETEKEKTPRLSHRHTATVLAE